MIYMHDLIEFLSFRSMHRLKPARQLKSIPSSSALCPCPVVRVWKGGEPVSPLIVLQGTTGLLGPDPESYGPWGTDSGLDPAVPRPDYWGGPRGLDRWFGCN